MARRAEADRSAPDDGRSQPTRRTNMTKTKTNGASTLRGRFAALRAALAAAMLEREGEIDAMLTALVAREHVVFLGIPGTGKSMLSRAIADAVTATHFEYLMTRFSTPDDFIGPYSLKALDHDSYMRVLKGRACDSEIVFLDEIFKSNAASLNAL